VNIIQSYNEPGTAVTSGSDMAGGPTSNMLVPKIGSALLPTFLVLELLTGGTSIPARQPPPAVSASVVPIPVTPRGEQASAAQEGNDSFLPELANSVRSLRQRSGLTLDELAYIFGVSRRTLHNWSTGGQVSASHAQAIASVIGAVHRVDTGNPKLTRSKLLAPTENGTTLFSRLAQQHRSIATTGGPAYRPDELLAARHDSPDPTGKLINPEQLP